MSQKFDKIVKFVKKDERGYVCVLLPKCRKKITADRSSAPIFL